MYRPIFSSTWLDREDPFSLLEDSDAKKVAIVLDADNGTDKVDSLVRLAQWPRWPNWQLQIRNLLLYDAQTLWLLVFIFKTCSD